MADDRAEALRLGQHGQHEPRVVGLAVVEQVAAGGRAVGERGQQLAAPRRPEITRWRAGLQSASSRTAPAPAQPVHGHHVVGVQPEADDAVQPRAVERGHDEPQRPDQVRRQVDVDLALEQRLAHQPEVEVLQVAQAAVDELATSATRCRCAKSARSTSATAVPARGGVQRDARAGDPAADHEHVERLGRERGDGVGAGQHVPARLPCAAMSDGFVQALWRFPVLGMAGEQLRSSQVDTRGVAGDRQHFTTGPEGRLTRAGPASPRRLDRGVPVQSRRRDHARPARRRSRC